MQAVPYLRVSNQKCSAVNSGAVNQRLDDAVATALLASNIGPMLAQYCAQYWDNIGHNIFL